MSWISFQRPPNLDGFWVTLKVFGSKSYPELEEENRKIFIGNFRVRKFFLYHFNKQFVGLVAPLLLLFSFSLDSLDGTGNFKLFCR